MRHPGILHLSTVIESSQTCYHRTPAGKWVPARPLGFPSFGYRIKAAWLVFTGRADALIWPAPKD
jgi:hypothetical protein